jgi:uncharacterized LabA/DUF88 family protein
MSETAFPEEQAQNSDRVILLVDGESLFQAAASQRFEVDYAKLLICLGQGRKLLHAYFYTGVSTGNQKQQAFLRWMQNNGYRVITKDLVARPDGKRSAELAVEIATDMLRLSEHTDVIVIVSGNADLVYAMNAIVNHGVQIELVGARSMTHDTLINACDRFIDIAEIKLQIQKAEKTD